MVMYTIFYLFPEAIGLDRPFMYAVPFSSCDYCEDDVVVDMLLCHTNIEVRYDDYIQYDTTQKVQSTFGNQVWWSLQAVLKALRLSDEKGGYIVFVNKPVLMLLQRVLEGYSKMVYHKW